MANLRKIFLNALLMAASILAFLLVLELFLRLFYPQNLNPLLLPTKDRDTFAQYDAELGWSLKPDAEAPLFSHEYNVLVKQNSQGMRDKEYSKKRLPGKVRIAITGDSFVWGFGVENKDIFTEIIENKLGEKFEVLNFGVSGYGADQELLQFKSKILDFKPDALIVAFYHNDIENIANSVEYGYEKPKFVLENGRLKLTNIPVPQVRRQETKYLIRDYINFFLSHYSHSYSFLKSGIAVLYDRATAVFQKPNEYFDTEILKKDYGEKYSNGWVLFDNLLREFKETGKNNNVSIILVNMPAKAQIDKRLFEKKLGIYGKSGDDYDLFKPSRLLKQYADKNGIMFIDLLPTFLSEDEPEKYYFKFNDHLNAQGNAFVAEGIYREMNPVLQEIN